MEALNNFFETKGVLLAQLIALFIFGLVFIQLFNKTAKKIAIKTALERSLAYFIVSLLNVFLYFALIIWIFSLLGFSTASFVALFSAFALALSLALKDSLSNIANGVILAVSKPFKAGDWISVANTDGIVKKIGIFYTQIVTFDNKVITLPNSQVMSSTITNFSARATRRSDLKFAVAYGSDVDKVKEIINATINEHPKVHKIPAPIIRLESLKESSVEFLARIWTAQGDQFVVYYELL
ncbi:MAG: mechanosensitive ion channel family protein, partial [Clostridia bacterium]|nr:mechanosensitive ion channel family protein [Clostridia bacterium]